MREIVFHCALVAVGNSNHYDILYSAPKTTVEAIIGFLST
jgi:hypothetical protein